MFCDKKLFKIFLFLCIYFLQKTAQLILQKPSSFKNANRIFTYSLTHSISHLLLTHSLTHSLTHPLTHSLTRSLAHSLTHSTKKVQFKRILDGYKVTKGKLLDKKYLPSDVKCDPLSNSAYGN